MPREYIGSIEVWRETHEDGGWGLVIGTDETDFDQLSEPEKLMMIAYLNRASLTYAEQMLHDRVNYQGYKSSDTFGEEDD